MSKQLSKYIYQYSQIQPNCCCTTISQENSKVIQSLISTKSTHSHNFIKLSSKQAKRRFTQNKLVASPTNPCKINLKHHQSKNHANLNTNAHQFQETKTAIKRQTHNQVKRKTSVRVMSTQPDHWSILHHQLQTFPSSKLKFSKKQTESNKQFKIASIIQHQRLFQKEKMKTTETPFQVSEIIEKSFPHYLNITKSIDSDLSRMSQLITDIQMINRSSTFPNNTNYWNVIHKQINNPTTTEN